MAHLSPVERERRKLNYLGGTYIRKLREKRGISKKDLADKLKVEVGQLFIDQVEVGIFPIPEDKYRVAAEALGVNTRDLVVKTLMYWQPEIYEVLFGAPSENELTGHLTHDELYTLEDRIDKIEVFK